MPFNRAKEAVKLVGKDFENFKDEELSMLKQALEELEQSLTQFRLNF